MTERGPASHEVERYFTIAPEMIIVAGFDGYWKHVNPAVAAVLGYTEHETLARPFMEFVHPEDRARTEEEARRVMGGANAFAFENRMVCKDGSYKWIEWTVTPVPAEGVMYGVGRDVTERHRSESQQAALQRIATLAAEAEQSQNLFAVVAEEVARVLDVPVVSVVRYESGDTGKECAAFPQGGLSSPTPQGWSIEAPIVVGGRTWGAIVASSNDEPLPPDTESRLPQFTELVATAIANVDARVEVQRLAEEQATLRRLATLVADGLPPTEIFAAVSQEVGRLFGTELTVISRFDPDGPATIVMGVAKGVEGMPVGSRWELDDGLAATQVYRTGRPARIDTVDWTSFTKPIGALARREGVVSTVATPIHVEGRLWGTISVPATEPLPPDAEQRLEKFTQLVATAISNAQSRDALARLAAEQAALRRVATLVARNATSTEVFEAVATEVGTLVEANMTVVGRYDGDGALTAIGTWSASDRGVPVGTRSAIGGRNALTIVAETAKPARIDGYDDASGEAAEIAREYGWHSSIAAPIVVEGRVWGVMLVATEGPEPFPVGAEERLAAFTELIATAVANTQAHHDLRRFGEEQAALGRVATLVAAGAPPERVFDAVVEEASSLLGLERIELVRYDGEGTGTVIAASGKHPFPAGSTWSLDDPSVMGMVARTKRAARLDDYGSLSGQIAEAAHGAGFQSAIGAPMNVEGRLWGVIIAISTDPEPIPERSEARLGQFTELVATAVANAESRSALSASRRRIVAASDETRRRIERDLHDGTQQRLVSLGLDLRTLEANLPPDRDDLREQVSGVATGLLAAVEDLQEISRGIHPAILSRGGIGAALQTLAHRSAIPVDLDIRTDVRLGEPIEVAAYFVASEALANAAKHSQASRIEISLEQRDGRLVLSIGDDGLGGADPSHGSGLVGLIDRVEALGGSIRVSSRPGKGTQIAAELPLEPVSSRPVS